MFLILNCLIVVIMSGQWEIVKSKKDKANGVTKKLTKADKKKFIENAPKVEDLRK